MSSAEPMVTRDDHQRELAGRSALSIKVVTGSLAIFGAVTFVACVLYGLVVPRPLHMAGFLESVLPGFRWLTVGGFVIGLVESFLYGVYVGLVFTPIYNALSRRWDPVRSG